MTVKGGTAPACAACKYQRRKCSPSCPLAPYFPADQPKTFQSVHRLFGVSKVTKTLKDLETKDKRDDAMRSIIYEAEMRQRFPVNGCCAVLLQLNHQLQLAYDELRHVCTSLEEWRLSDVGGPSSGNEAAAAAASQFVLDENGGSVAEFEAHRFKDYVVDGETSSSRFSQMEDFETQRFKNYAVSERSSGVDEEMCSRFSEVASIREGRVFYENDLSLNGSNASKYYDSVQ